MSDFPPEDQPVTHVCHKCSAQSIGPGKFCPNCGASFVRNSTPKIKKKFLVTAALALALIVAVTTGLVLKNNHENQVEADRVAAAERADNERIAENKEQADEAERLKRSEWVSDLEGYIKKDAKKHVKNGLLEGPILNGSCTATGGGSTDDLTALTGTFDCMAVSKENKDGTHSGYTYAGTIDWKQGEFTWKLGN